MQFATGMITLVAVYCPPRYSIKLKQYFEYFKILEKVFIAGEDYNAKHTLWDSRVVSPGGRPLFNAMQTLKLNHTSSGFPSDCQKVTDLIDFCVKNCVPVHNIIAETLLDLSSDHVVMVFTLNDCFLINKTPLQLHSKKTNI